MADNPTTQRIAAGSGVVLQVSLGTSDHLVQIVVEKQGGPACVLHWGLSQAGGRGWQIPPNSAWPPGSTPASQAVDTPLAGEAVTVRLEDTWRFAFFDFVLFDPKASRWDNNQGRNYRVVLPSSDSRPATAAYPPMAEEIIARETSPNSWTLMHRFNLAWELLDRVPADGVQELALIFVWLRFSAIRQLDWQRHYNTQPRELAHAQDRLTLKLCERAAESDAEMRLLLRMIAGTLGRGGEGQRVRDGILEIMHRNRIKEVAGHFLEEWHQKLHNNTTPDDVVICEAYLEFLRTSGDQAAFYRALEAGGVGRQRLLGFERPIRSHPDFVPHLRDALLHDFGEFLGVLRSLHSATDFGVLLQAARGFVDESTRQRLDEIWHRREEPQARSWLVQAITEVREILAAELHPGRAGLRDLLYLDLGLEDLLRGLVERNLHEQLSLDELVGWTQLALRNLVLTRTSAELILCLRHMKRLWQLPRAGQEWALHAQAVMERVRRELVRLTDADVRLLQPMAEHLGQAFGAEAWTVQSFAEEVLRGRIEFAVSALLRKLDELLRQIVGLGHWQIVSRGQGKVQGVVRIRRSLAEAQGQPFDTSTVLVAGPISGEEDIPAGVVAVLTDSAVDLMAHVAVRARNAGVLLATGWDADRLASLRAREGQWASLSVGAEGEIVVEAVEPPAAQPTARPGIGVRRDGPEDCEQGHSFKALAFSLSLRERVGVRVTTPSSATAGSQICATSASDSEKASPSPPTPLPKGEGRRMHALLPESPRSSRLMPTARPVRMSSPVLPVPPASAYVIAEAGFEASKVGGKSRNLGELRGRLPAWIGVPTGVALPYGVCERVLAEPNNQNCASRYHALVRQLQDTAALQPQAILAELCQVTLALNSPMALEAELHGALVAAGVPSPDSYAEAWMCIKHVWASKWNARAYFSRRSMGIPDESLAMSVLVQEVVPADYAFVIHTANPMTGDRDELVAEIVVGLGETLVGNHPGRALGFRHRRSTGTTLITSFPSKSLGLFGQGLMFRSDSNGEDLAGFAGAGLYDSYQLPQARATPLDYEKEALLWDEGLRHRVLEGVAEVGIAVEKVFGTPQDIEGVYANGRFFVVQSRPQVGLDHG